MAKTHLRADIIEVLRAQLAAGVTLLSADDITAKVAASRATVGRYLNQMVEDGELVRKGAGPATRYALPSPPIALPPHAIAPPAVGAGFAFSVAAAPLIAQLQAPIGSRAPVSYGREFVDAYEPNRSSLLPHDLADRLYTRGKAHGQQPAGTYARKVLEQLLIDLAWHSSRLEGNRKSLLDTQQLFARGRTQHDDTDAVMLLNHKDAIEFVVDAVPEYGITEAVVRNIQSLLMNGLLANPDALGAIRRTLVNIEGSVYMPLQAPQLMAEMLARIIDKVRQIKNPVEAAFFLWLNIAYLQPFEDGNKRTSRLCANLPLLLQNCAPLSFLDVELSDYAMAVLAVYEQRDVSLAVELFEWTYLRSIQKYQVILAAMGAPDPFRAKYRELLGDGVRLVVAERTPLAAVADALQVPQEDVAEFQALLKDELLHLADYNCARYRLGFGLTTEWIKQGRPGL
ncbi:MAG TPA: Fic family protein [Rhodocyclaceae bacterium]|nr:Fic family protein [Rhodocyclaceae bacterium]